MKFAEHAKVVWEIFKRDIKALLKNPIAMIVTIGVIFLPSVYAWATIGADWDPYERTQYLKVGFANLDEGANSANLKLGTEVGGDGTGGKAENGEATEKFGAGAIENETEAKNDGTDTETELNLGKQVEEELRNNHDLGWQFVSEEEAMTGVESGEYYAAIVIPQDFSRDFLSVLTGEYQRPEIKYYVNEKVSATAPEFTNSGANAVENEINAQFTGTVSKAMVELMQAAGRELDTGVTAAGDNLASGVAETKTEIGTAMATIDGYEASVGEMQGAVAEVRGVLESVKGTLPGASGAITGAQGRVDALRGNLTELSDGVRKLAETLNQAEGALQGTLEKLGAVNPKFTEISEKLGALQQQLLGIQGQLGLMSTATLGATNSFSGALGTLNGVVLELEPILTAAEGGLAQIDSTLDLAVNAGEGAKAVLNVVDKVVGEAQTDLAAVASTEVLERVQKILEVKPEEISQFMASPVELKTETLYPIRNYGSGVAPFFTNIAMWVAGFILVAILHLTVDPKGLPKFGVTEAYLGRLALFVLIGILQGLVVCTGDLVMGIQCAEPGLFLLAGVVTIVLDVNIMYALVFTMRHIGRAIGVVLLIMQIPGASGEYPVQMMPQFYQVIHPFLPFTYSIDAMRQATGGMYGAQYWVDLAALLPFLVLALIIGLGAGRHAFNLNALFDKELGETELLITEKEGVVAQKYRLRPMLAILLKDKGYREKLLGRAERFQKRYPLLIRLGWILLISIPIAMVLIGMILPRSADIRLILLLLMVVGIILTTIYMVSVEFLKYNLSEQANWDYRGGTGGRKKARVAVEGVTVDGEIEEGEGDSEKEPVERDDEGKEKDGDDRTGKKQRRRK